MEFLTHIQHTNLIYQTNVFGTLNILEACKENKSIKRIIHTSTSEVYGSAQHIPIKSHPLVGQSPYAASKIAADKLALSFYLTFNIPLITVKGHSIRLALDKQLVQ